MITSHMRRAGSGLVDAAGHQTFLVDDVAVVRRPFAPDEMLRIAQIRLLGIELAPTDRERELPLALLAHRLHELIGDQQRQVELPQPAVLALGAHEIHGVGMADVEGAHLRAAPAAGRGHGETHLVVDIHERQRARGIGAGARHIGAARPQRREFVADAAAGLERQAGLVHLAEDVVHRIADRARHGAVDGRGRGLVLQGAGIRGHAPGRNRPVAQCPQKALIPALAYVLALDIGQRAGDTFISVVHAAIDRLAVLGTEPILLIPDIQRGFLVRDGIDVADDEFHNGIHSGGGSPFREIGHTMRPAPDTRSSCVEGGD